MSFSGQERFSKQLDFIREIDKVKSIFRQTLLMDGSRKENDAEHSWHIATMAVILGEYAPEGTDLTRVIKMVLIHDLVEIDAGDTYLFDDEGNKDKAEREQKAAERIFGLLPSDLSEEIMGLWVEFEERTSSESRFAALMDRFQPFLHNMATEGESWQEHGVKRSQVLARMKPVLEPFPLFWDYLRNGLDHAVAQGWLLEG